MTDRCHCWCVAKYGHEADCGEARAEQRRETREAIAFVEAELLVPEESCE